MKWIIAILIVLILVLVGLSKAGIIGGDEGLKVTGEKAAVRNITEIVTASGKIFPEVEVKVSPDISGEIVELNVLEGDTVFPDISADDWQEMDSEVFPAGEKDTHATRRVVYQRRR